jgi:hypothetical protein
VAVAITIVLVLGVALAVAKPGNLDHSPKNNAAATSTTTSTTVAAPATTASTTTTSTTQPQSGLSATGSGSAGHRGLATTGGMPWAVPGVALLVAAVVIRRLTATN